MKVLLRYSLLIVALLFMTYANSYAQSGGVLSPEQAAYDVNYYDLDLTINPTDKTIGGSLLCRVEIIDPIDTLVLDLDDPFTVDSILFKINSGTFSNVAFTHTARKIKAFIPVPVITGDMVTVQIFYNGAPKLASSSSLGEGFVWDQTSTGEPWIGVMCEIVGAYVWWPCKDHPSDEPDSMSLSFTVPNPLICVSNGRYLGSIDNGNNTTTFDWFISTPINNYNVTFYAAEYSLIEDAYLSISDDTIPFYFWVLPEKYETAINYMGVFLTEFDFLESICGPFPFRTDKLGWAHAPYWGMEHQTIIAYGSDFEIDYWGMDFIHYHELAHEWWGNLITAKDWSDVWIHEGMATYTQAIYVEHISGMDSYHQFINERRSYINQTSYPLAPLEPSTAFFAFYNLQPNSRGALVMHTLRYHLGDESFFNLFKRWLYPDSTDYDNTNGRLCRILSTDDMKVQAEEVTGVDLDPFFDVFFREAAFPVLHVLREINEATFTWETENNVLLDVNIPIFVNGTDQVVEMTYGQGSIAISINDTLVIDPQKWIFMAPPSIVTSVEDDLTKITDYQLEQNYPNPFSFTTTIKFSIPKSQFVTLKIFDIQGNEIITLVNGKQSPGIYVVEFDGSNLTTGKYFYRLQAGDYSETKSFVFNK